ncbi:hypothetical protein RIF29_40769 [Crotalaria pallida]|uniref:Uncharacterized protein n=1 Tax=Crotalaria pallida TaxID=3830 RepID=A0AAN9E4B2_CROPI
MSSARVSRDERENEGPSIQEDDLKKRSTKKVKVGDDDSSSSPMEEDRSSNMISVQKSYKDTLLRDSSTGPLWEAIEIDDEDLPENKWYKEENDEVDNEEFDPYRWWQYYYGGAKCDYGGRRIFRRRSNNRRERDWCSTNVKENGSRFHSLSADAEAEVTELPHINGSGEQYQDNSLGKKQAQLGRKPIKIRNSTGGKNPQSKYKQINKGPNTPVQKESSSKSNPEVTVTQNQHNISEEQERNSKEKEVRVLHRMRTLMKQGHNGIDGFTTRVVLPNVEMVDFNLLQRGKNTVINPSPEQPDLAVRVDGGEASKPNDDGGTEMLIEVAPMSSLQPNMQKDGFRPASSSLERLPSNNYQ